MANKKTYQAPKIEKVELVDEADINFLIEENDNIEAYAPFADSSDSVD